MDKDDVARVYSGILLSHEKSETQLLAVTWMDLGNIRLSEMSEKDKHMISLICGI